MFRYREKETSIGQPACKIRSESFKKYGQKNFSRRDLIIDASVGSRPWAEIPEVGIFYELIRRSLSELEVRCRVFIAKIKLGVRSNPN